MQKTPRTHPGNHIALSQKPLGQGFAQKTSDIINEVTEVAVLKNELSNESFKLTPKKTMGSQVVGLLNTFTGKKGLLERVSELSDDHRFALAYQGIACATKKEIVTNILSELTLWKIASTEHQHALFECALNKYEGEILSYIPESHYTNAAFGLLAKTTAFDYKKLLDETYKAEGAGERSAHASNSQNMQRGYRELLRNNLFLQIDFQKIGKDALPILIDKLICADPAIILESISSSTQGGIRKNPLTFLKPSQQLDILTGISQLGLGLATKYFHLFSIPTDTPSEILQNIWISDVTRGVTSHGSFEAFLDVGRFFPTFGVTENLISLPSFVSYSQVATELRSGALAAKQAQQNTLSEVDRLIEQWNGTVTVDREEIQDVVRDTQTKELASFYTALRLHHNRLAKNHANGSTTSKLFSETKTEILFGDREIKPLLFVDLYAHTLFSDASKLERTKRNASTLLSDGYTPQLGTWYAHFELNKLSPMAFFGSKKLYEKINPKFIRELISVASSIRNKTSPDYIGKFSPSWNDFTEGFDNSIPKVFGYVYLYFHTIDMLISALSLEHDTHDVMQIIDSLSSAISLRGSDNFQLKQILESKEKHTTLSQPQSADALTAHIEGFTRFAGMYIHDLAQRKYKGNPANLVGKLHLPRRMSDRLLTAADRAKKGS